jgi:spermidine synthase
MSRRLLLQTQTRLTGLRIEQQGEQRLLRFDRDGEAIQSSIDLNQPQQLHMVNLRYLMGILMFIPEPRSILLLGVGGGALIHFLRHQLPQAHITGVEYDVELLELAQQHLHLPSADERLLYVIEDAREYTRYCQQRFDLIVSDIFSGPYSPPWLLNRDSIEALRNCLSGRGAIAYNLLVHKEKSFTNFYRQLRQAYQHQTLSLEADDYQNLLVYALNFTPEKTDMTYWMQRAQQLNERYELPFSDILATIYNINPVASGVI